MQIKKLFILDIVDKQQQQEQQQQQDMDIKQGITFVTLNL